MNANLERLNLIYSLLNDLVNNNLKYEKNILSQIIGLFIDITSHIDFLLKEYYFTNIIEFESHKKKIIHKLILIKNILSNCNVNSSMIIKIDDILTISKIIMYPAHLNLNNISKYKNEIKNTIKFYHKPKTLDIKNNFYDEEYEIKEFEFYKQKLINHKTSEIKKQKLQNTNNFVINNNLKGKNFIKNINFYKSAITI